VAVDFEAWLEADTDFGLTGRTELGQIQWKSEFGDGSVRHFPNDPTQIELQPGR
jgi:hypothetical protein